MKSGAGRMDFMDQCIAEFKTWEEGKNLVSEFSRLVSGNRKGLLATVWS